MVCGSVGGVLLSESKYFVHILPKVGSVTLSLVFSCPYPLIGNLMGALLLLFGKLHLLSVRVILVLNTNILRTRAPFFLLELLTC